MIISGIASNGLMQQMEQKEVKNNDKVLIRIKIVHVRLSLAKKNHPDSSEKGAIFSFLFSLLF